MMNNLMHFLEVEIQYVPTELTNFKSQICI